jgi:hypothetical protein
MWWWQFNKTEPLQEDLVVYEKFMEIKEDRQRMNREKEHQKASLKSGKSKSISGKQYTIPDPI